MLWVDLLFAGFWLCTAWIASRAAAPSPAAPPTPWAPTVTLLRPCEGVEPGLRAALHVPGVEVIVCVPSEDDPSAQVAREEGVRRALDRPETAAWTNPKARRLDAGLAASTGEVVVLADADAQVDSELLAALLDALRAPGVVGVFACPVAARGRGWGNRVLRVALGGSLYAWPALVALTRALGAPVPISGALVVFRRADLPEGFASSGNAIGDDLALAEALQRRGRVALLDRPVVCVHGEIPLAQAASLLRRWVRVASLHAPARLLGYPLIFCATPLLLALLAATVSLPPARAAVAAPLLLGAFAARMHAARVISRRMLGEASDLRALLVVEAVLLDAALRAAAALVAGRELAWRDRRYRIGRGGQIRSVRRVGA